jgi:sulfotransferase
MGLRIHFISGLPRSGSTLLAALLRQNPLFHAAISSPAAELVKAVLAGMASQNELAASLSECQRERVLRSILEAQYKDLCGTTLVFDTNRTWCSLVSVLSRLFPDARLICCIRNPAWILDSAERQVQRYPFHTSRMFGREGLSSVYERVDALVRGNFLGGSMNALRQAWFSEEAHRMIAIRYDSLARSPRETLARLYDFLGESPFAHDFENVSYDAGALMPVSGCQDSTPLRDGSRHEIGTRFCLSIYFGAMKPSFGTSPDAIRERSWLFETPSSSVGVALT